MFLQSRSLEYLPITQIKVHGLYIFSPQCHRVQGVKWVEEGEGENPWFPQKLKPNIKKKTIAVVSNFSIGIFF
mgnify:CR=1 FL=1